ncbi:acidic leucine-rich nuclear phosphoprotein 32-related protein-like [Culex quinquefasciatus]|uniref:acidic leucine-rich nuclear phosphoprotein 32-related protein-like n=1 Tax=Culex quinquefasciatus TaxID=7176 RepID=UPI0018E2FE82|nr:acidic leucine-rich nuclear phosphoprotein 32-related protein-like [Culex quinquefasciatus]
MSASASVEQTSGTGAASVLPTCQQRKPEGGEADDGTAGSSSHGEPPTNDAEDTQLNFGEDEEGEYFDDDDDPDLTPAERRRRSRIHHFTFKLNSIELSIIEEKTDEDSNRQSPEEAFLRSKISGQEDKPEAPSSPLRLEDRKDPEGQAAPAGESVDSEGNIINESEGAGHVEEENSSEKSLKGFEDVERMLEKMPSTARLNRMLTRFYSFDQPRDREDDEGSDEDGEFPRRKISLREFKAKMSSMTALDGFDESGSEEEGPGEGDEPDEADDGEDGDVDAAIDELLAESIPNGEEVEEMNGKD